MKKKNNFDHGFELKCLNGEILIKCNKNAVWLNLIALKGKISSQIQENIILQIGRIFKFMPRQYLETEIEKVKLTDNKIINDKINNDKINKEDLKVPNLFYKENLNNTDEIIFYCGSFNPFHLGHVECIKQAKQFQKPILLIPDHNPWKDNYKINANRNPLDQLIDLYKEVKSLGVSIFPSFIAKNTPNPTVSWIDDVKIKKKYLLMGDDCFLKIDQWKNSNLLLNKINGLYVVPRLVEKELLLKQKYILKKINKDIGIHFLANHQFENISSTGLRD